MDLKERKLINNTNLPKFGLGTTIAQEYADDEYNEALLSGELGPNPNKAGATALFNDQMAETGVKPKQNMFKSMISDAFSKDTLKSAANVGIGVAGNIVGNTAKSLISGDNESAVGNVLGDVTNQLGGALSNVNPILGGIVNIGGGIISGGINALFGSNKKKEQEEKLRRARLQREQELANVRDKEWSSKINNDFMQKYGDLDAQQSLYAAKEGVYNFNNALNKFTKEDHAINTPYGLYKGKANAKVSKGEVIASEDGSLYKVPFGKNDNAYAFLNNEDSVYSTKIRDPFTGLKMADAAPLYVAQGRKDLADFAQDLGRDMKYNKYNNKIGKFDKGTNYNYITGNLLSTIGNLWGARQQYKEASEPLRYPNVYAPNEQFGKAQSILDGLGIDYYPVIAQNKNIESAMKYNIRRSGGLSTGQKMLLNRQLTYDTERNNADVFFKHALQNNQYRQLAAQERMRAGQDAARMKMQANMFDEDMLAKAHNASVQDKQMSLFNTMNAIQQFYANEFKHYQFNRAMNLYEQEQRDNAADRKAKTDNIKNIYVPKLQSFYKNAVGDFSRSLFNPTLPTLDEINSINYGIRR